jgi:hypothetical protein
MQIHRFTSYWFVITFVAFNLQACGSIQQIIQGSPTPTPTETPTLTFTPTLTPTPTLKPTPTLTSTATPNLVATQQYEAFLPLVQKYFDAGYIPSMNGTYYQLDDYSDSLAKRGNYQWATLGMNVTNFIIKSRVTMSTANKSAPETGCGIVFRTIGNFLQAVYIAQDDKAYFVVHNQINDQHYFNEIPNPAEFELILIINERYIKFYIDGKEALVYETYIDTHAGDLGFTVISGSNEDYGSRCDFKNTELWVIK